MNKFVPLHLYLHIPFCRKKCGFCDCPTQIISKEQSKAFVDAMILEMKAAAQDFETHTVASIRVGGGSPTALESEDFIRLMRAIPKMFRIQADAQVSVEAVPNMVDAGWMVRFQQTGVNRVIWGAASGRDEELELLGMDGTVCNGETALVLSQMFKLSGYETQLFYGIPGQTADHLLTSVRFAIKYNSPEITLLPLRVTEGTAWVAKLSNIPSKLTEAECEALLAKSHTHLIEKGYRMYLPGHYAKQNMENADEIARCGTEDYLSFGPGTVSRTDGVCYRTTANLAQYLAHADDAQMLYTLLENKG